ncbi:MAG: hypothetical protein ACO3XO_02925 [Bdellovibrionota bacterium]
MFKQEGTSTEGPVPIANILDTFMREFDEKRAAVVDLQRLFDGLRAYIAPGEEGGSIVHLDELNAFTRNVAIPLGSNNGTLHIGAVIGGGADGVVFHGRLEERETGTSRAVAAKFSYPFERIGEVANLTCISKEDAIEAVSMQFVAVTEQAVHDRLQKVGFSSVPKLFMSTVIDSIDETEDAIALTVMEHVHGKELDQLAIEIGRGKATFASLRPVLEGMVEVLSGLAERGIYVWDTNAKNVLIRDHGNQNRTPEVVLLDFGRANITGKGEFFQAHGLGWHPEIPENSGESPTTMEKTVVSGIGEAWLGVAKKIKVSGKAAHPEASLLESLSQVLRTGEVSTLEEIPRLIDRIFQGA